VAELPHGTVTFLFTDIEGSTRLLKQLGDRYGAVLDDHRRLLREEVAERDGREVDTQGDSFFFAFARANAALGAAVAAQRALAAHEWPEGAVVRVRMGLHTGEPAVGDERYVGLGVHRAARIGAVAHGGQVLLSSATRELVEDEAGGVAVRDLGFYRLKDIDRPERLYQLDIEGLQSQFAPLTAPKVAERGPLYRRPVVLAALAGVVAVAIAVPLLVFGQGGGQGGGFEGPAAANSLGFVDPNTARLAADVEVGGGPSQVVSGGGDDWVVNTAGNSVSVVDPTTRHVIQTIGVGSGPDGITFGGGDVWVANGLDGTVYRIDPATKSVVQMTKVGAVPAGMLFADGAVWVANTGDGTISRIDAASGEPGKSLPVAANEFAFGAGSIWASQSSQGQVAQINPATGAVVGTTRVGNGPGGITFGDGAVWVANSLDGTVSRINPATGSVNGEVATGNGPTALAVGSGGVWVSNRFDGTVARIDPQTLAITHRIEVGSRLGSVASVDGGVLVTVEAPYVCGK